MDLEMLLLRGSGCERLEMEVSARMLTVIVFGQCSMFVCDDFSPLNVFFVRRVHGIEGAFGSATRVRGGL